VQSRYRVRLALAVGKGDVVKLDHGSAHLGLSSASPRLTEVPGP
jgi:hypothetical protein